MSKTPSTTRQSIPAVHRVLDLPAVQALILEFGRELTTDAVRKVLADTREALANNQGEVDEARIVADILKFLTSLVTPSLRPVFNLTGTVLHTNLGRAPMPPEAIEAMNIVAAGASNLEYDLVSGKRGDRDSHLESWICRLTGAEAATVVNNNAAAVLLVLNSLANRREVPVSRGELVEIGGAFRIPDIMKRAGSKLVEVGTTNRTHLKDFAEAINAKTAMLMKVHASNYAVEGFTATVPEPDLAALAHQHDVAFIVDLGSGTLVDLTAYGLPPEQTVAETISQGADVVTFSGDKLLGGPQAGIIAGRADLIAKIKKNPIKRALRVDKMTIAALAAIFRLYTDKERLVRRLPSMRLLGRAREDIEATAQRLRGPVADKLADGFEVAVMDCQSQIGSGALPVDVLPSAALSLTPTTGKRGSGTKLKRLAAALRALPVPVIGHIRDGACVLDMRCLEQADEARFTDQIELIDLP
jgi:L-seryl-tRNA(Ser) seleniumtransferase